MPTTLPFRKFIFFAGVVCASVFLSFLIDDNLGPGWPTNVIRNWQEYGFFNLHGKLVYNAGGSDVSAHPQVYGGMSPVSLYPVLFATRIFSWTGLNIESFHIALLIV